MIEPRALNARELCGGSRDLSRRPAGDLNGMKTMSLTDAQSAEHANGGEAAPPLDVASIREQFPILRRTVHDKPLVYLDNAATSLTPECVVEAVADYYRQCNANVHRGLHALSEEADRRFEGAREKVQHFVHAERMEEIVFTRGTTEAINLVAYGFAEALLEPGDEVLISGMEHHANIVPWQRACERSGATLHVAPITDAGEIDSEGFTNALSDRTRIVALPHISNVLGTVNDVAAIVRQAHEAGAAVLMDGAQAAPHVRVDVQSLDCDFYAFSGHKMYGPTGIGVLYGKHDWLEKLPPYQGGGDMIKSVSFEKTVYNDPPFKFEAGTPSIAGAIGLGAAVDFMNRFDHEAVEAHEARLVRYAREKLGEFEGLKLLGDAPERIGAFSFLLDEIHPYDMAPLLDHEGVAVRTGHHCAQPLMERFGVNATVRASLGIYNTEQEIDTLVQAMRKVQSLFSRWS